jgi:hypothetical protein
MIDNLIKQYKNTINKVFKPNLKIQVGVLNNDLNDLLGKNNATKWAYITAYKSFSRILTDIENQGRHLELNGLTSSYLIF